MALKTKTKCQLSVVSVPDIGTHVGQVITQTAQLLITVRTVFVRARVLLLCPIFPFGRRRCFHGFRDHKPAYVGGNKAGTDGMLKVGL